MDWSELIYRTVDLGGHVSDWHPVPEDRFVLLPSPTLHNPDEIVVRVEFGSRGPWPGPGWYGPAIDGFISTENHPTELKWVARRDDVPEGWQRWALRIPGLG